MALRDAICRGDVSTTKTILSELGSKEEFIVNMAPNGTTTLLYWYWFKILVIFIIIIIVHFIIISACEVGKKDLVKMLLDHKADGRIHPITRYSPLYVVAFKGKKDVIEILLKVQFINLDI